jgi:nicotinic acid phosphoribosyltransferase
MGIRIDSISRREFGRHFSWHLRAKGYDGLGIYFSCWMSTPK